MISPITFLVGLFKPGVRIYETNNTGRWYDLGFLMGASMALGGGMRGNMAKPPCGKEELDREDE